MITIINSKFLSRYLPMFLSVVLIVGAAFTYLIYVAPKAYAAIALVNAAAGNVGGASGATAGLNVTTGNLLVVIVSFNANGSGCGASTITISDNAPGGSNTYTPISTQISQSFNCSKDYYVKNAVGKTPLNITAFDSANNAKIVVALQFSGVDQTNPLDSSASLTKICAGSPCLTTSFSTASANEVVVDLASDFNAGAWTAGNIGGQTSAIPVGGSQNNANGNMSAAGEYFIFSSIQTSITASITKGTPTQIDSFVAAFKAATPVVTISNRGLTIQNAKVCIGGCNKISLVQSASATTSSGTTLAVPFSANNTPNNLLLVVASAEGTGPTISINDSGGNSYTQVSNVTYNSTPHNIFMYYAVANGGPNTVTATIVGGSNNLLLEVYEYSGAKASAPLDQATTTTAVSCAGACITTPNLTTSVPGEMLFAAVGAVGSTGTGSFVGTDGQGKKLVQRLLLNANGNGTNGFITSEDLDETMPGVYSATFNYNPTVSFGGMILATFLPASQTGGKLRIQPQ